MAVLEYDQFRSSVIDGAPTFPASSIAFDDEEERLWVGTSSGRIISYCAVNLQEITSFQIAESKPVFHIETVEDQVILITEEYMTCRSKNGDNQFDFEPIHPRNLTSGLLYKEATVLLGTTSSIFHTFDLFTGEYNLHYFPNEENLINGVSVLRCNPAVICVGDNTGTVTLRDPANLKEKHAIKVHKGPLVDMDIRDNKLVTCGKIHGPRSFQKDEFVKVFDIRMMSHEAEFRAPLQPRFTRLAPKFQKDLIIMTEDCSVIMTKSDFPISKITSKKHSNDTCGNISAFAISQKLDALAFGDSEGQLQLLLRSKTSKFHQDSNVSKSSIPNPMKPTNDGSHLVSNQTAIFSLRSVGVKQPADIQFTPLKPEESPLKPGMLLSLDSEFVAMSNEGTGLGADGAKFVSKPKRLAVARVTVVRGQGEMEGIPFIDDYISTKEKVVDYLTEFSGIRPGDLDPKVSSKYLSTLKMTRKKLSYLIDKKCTFVGHDLQNDFKVIKIVVPHSQIRDTVRLYHLPGRRLVSLKFLAWYVLGMKIQKGEHDSVEDARTTLKLYKKYLELTETYSKAIMFPKYLTIMYQTGDVLNWKIPEQEY